MPESPEDRLARLFNMGAYGRELAKEILEDHLRVVIDDLHDAGLGLAATYLENKHGIQRR